MKKEDLKNFPHLFSNISNWVEYTFYKGERNKRNLRFVTKPNKIRFEVTPTSYWVFKEVFVEDFYNIRELLKKVPEAPLVIDVGANAGYFDVLLLSKRKNARIIAFEPLANNKAYIQRMIDANPALQNQLTVHQKAVTGTPVDHIKLYMEDTAQNTEIASIYASFDPRNTRTVEVPAVTLSSVIREHAQVDLLKMDCEGSEYDILYNTPAEDLKRVKLMALEVHQMQGEGQNLEALDAFLKGHGFTTVSTPITKETYYLEAYA
ncbi:MAG: FkbM family methyltransferase [Chitinophagaceae bacterium]|nr:MAG: FkbM family methyltransferase [Chitinophagaceae bacterium]